MSWVLFLAIKILLYSFSHTAVKDYDLHRALLEVLETFKLLKYYSNTKMADWVVNFIMLINEVKLTFFFRFINSFMFEFKDYVFSFWISLKKTYLYFQTRHSFLWVVFSVKHPVEILSSRNLKVSPLWQKKVDITF